LSIESQDERRDQEENGIIPEKHFRSLLSHDSQIL
jgi:hypothetical protein